MTDQQSSPMSEAQIINSLRFHGFNAAADLIERFSAEIASGNEWYDKECVARLAAEARLTEAEKVIQFAHDGYENHDVNHIDYRMKVYQACLDYLEKHPRSGAVGQQQDSGADR